MKKVLLLLADGFETFEASVFIDVIGWNLVEGDKSTQLFTCGLVKELNSSFDQKFVVDFTIDEINVKDYAAVAIPGGFEVYGFYKHAYDERFTNLIKEFYEQDKVVSSICVGALPVAKSGILQRKRATVYNNPIRRKALEEFGAEVVDEPLVISGNITTSWNPSTAMDVAYYLLRQLTTKENELHIRKLMGF